MKATHGLRSRLAIVGLAVAALGANAQPTAPGAPADAATPPARAASASTRVDGLDLKAERERIQRERAAARASQVREEADCQKRFAVTSCLDDARRRWQAVLADLRRQDVALSDAERRQRGAEQLRSLDERAGARAQDDTPERRAQSRAEHEDRQARDADRASAAQPSGKPRPAASQARAHAPALTPEQEAANRQAHERRLQEAQERRERLRERQAARTKPPASSLPVPP